MYVVSSLSISDVLLLHLLSCFVAVIFVFSSFLFPPLFPSATPSFFLLSTSCPPVRSDSSIQLNLQSTFFFFFKSHKYSFINWIYTVLHALWLKLCFCRINTKASGAFTVRLSHWTGLKNCRDISDKNLNRKLINILKNSIIFLKISHNIK